MAADTPNQNKHMHHQLVLDFPMSDSARELLLETPASQTARIMLSRTQFWPDGQMSLIGSKQSGKTKFLRYWAEQEGAAYVRGQDLADASIGEISSLSIKALAIDDADKCSSGINLLAAYNLCRDREAALLISGESDPSQWQMSPPDLQSRLSATPIAKIDDPDEITLKMRLVSACKTKFMKLPDETADYLSQRLVRSYEIVDKIVESLERAANGNALTKHTARRAMAALDETHA